MKKRYRISNSEITFVIQGPIANESQLEITNNLIGDIKKHFKKSKIILSTWEESLLNIQHEIDEVVVSKDPGGKIAVESTNTLNNVNRQIISTLNGLKKVHTKYSVKIRNDMRIDNENILTQLNNRPSRVIFNEYDILNEYVLITNITSINPRLNLKLPYHPCDWFFAGLTSDLLEIWNINLMPDNWFQWFKFNPWPKNSWYQEQYLSLYRPESYIWSSCIRKNNSLIFSHCFDNSGETISESETYFSRNLKLMTNKLLGIRSEKHRMSLLAQSQCYTISDWKQLAIRNGVDVDEKIDFESIVINFIRKYYPLIFKIKSLLTTLAFYLSLLVKSNFFRKVLKKIFAFFTAKNQLAKERLQLFQLQLISFIIGINTNLIQGPAGNTSLKNKNSIYVKASGAQLRKSLRKFAFVKLTDDFNNRNHTESLERNVVKPTMEYRFHLGIPKRAVLHVHSVGSVSLGLRTDLKKILAGSRIESKIEIIPFRIPGEDLSKEILQNIQNFDETIGALLQNHGLIIWGDSLITAYIRLIIIEKYILRLLKKEVKRNQINEFYNLQDLVYLDLTPDQILFNEQIREPILDWHFHLRDALQKSVHLIPKLAPISIIDKPKSFQIKSLTAEQHRKLVNE